MYYNSIRIFTTVFFANDVGSMATLLINTCKTTTVFSCSISFLKRSLFLPAAYYIKPYILIKFVKHNEASFFVVNNGYKQQLSSPNEHRLK